MINNNNIFSFQVQHIEKLNLQITNEKKTWLSNVFFWKTKTIKQKSGINQILNLKNQSYIAAHNNQIIKFHSQPKNTEEQQIIKQKSLKNIQRKTQKTPFDNSIRRILKSPKGKQIFIENYLLVYDGIFIYLIDLKLLVIKEQLQTCFQIVDMICTTNQNIIIISRSQIYSLLIKNFHLQQILGYDLLGQYQNSKIIYYTTENKLLVLSILTQEIGQKINRFLIVRQFSHDNTFKQIELNSKVKLLIKRTFNENFDIKQYNNLIQIKFQLTYYILRKEQGQWKIFSPLRLNNNFKHAKFMYVQKNILCSKYQNYIYLNKCSEDTNICTEIIDLIQLQQSLINFQLLEVFINQNQNIQFFLKNPAQQQLFLIRNQNLYKLHCIKTVFTKKLPKLLKNDQFTLMSMKQIALSSGISLHDFWLAVWKDHQRTMWGVGKILLNTKNYKTIRKQIKLMLRIKGSQNISVLVSDTITLQSYLIESSLDNLKNNFNSLQFKYFLKQSFIMKKLQFYSMFYQHISYGRYQHLKNSHIFQILRQKINNYSIQQFKSICQTFKLAIVTNYNKFINKIFDKQGQFMLQTLKYFYFILPSADMRKSCQQLCSHRIAKQQIYFDSKGGEIDIWKDFTRQDWMFIHTKQDIISILKTIKPQIIKKQCQSLLNQFMNTNWCQQKLLIKHQYLNNSEQQIKNIHLSLMSAKCFHVCMDKMVVVCNSDIQILNKFIDVLIQFLRLKENQPFTSQLRYYSNASLIIKKSIFQILQMDSDTFFNYLTKSDRLPLTCELNNKDLINYLSNNIQSLLIWQNSSIDREIIHDSLMKVKLKEFQFLQQRILSYFNENQLEIFKQYYEHLKILFRNFSLEEILIEGQNVVRKSIQVYLQGNQSYPPIKIQEKQLILDNNPLNLLPLLLYLQPLSIKGDQLISLYLQILLQYQLSNLIIVLIEDGSLQRISQNHETILKNVYKKITSDVYSQAQSFKDIQQFIIDAINILKNNQHLQLFKLYFGLLLQQVKYDIKPIDILQFKNITSVFQYILAIEDQYICQIPIDKIYIYYRIIKDQVEIQLDSPEANMYLEQQFFQNVVTSINFKLISKNWKTVFCNQSERIDLLVYRRIVQNANSQVTNKSHQLLQYIISLIKKPQNIQNINQNQINLQVLDYRMIGRYSKQLLNSLPISQAISKLFIYLTINNRQLCRFYIYEAIFYMMFVIGDICVPIMVHSLQIDVYVIMKMIKQSIRCQIFKYNQACLILYRLFLHKLWNKSNRFEEIKQQILYYLQDLQNQDKILCLINYLKMCKEQNQEQIKHIYFYIEALLIQREKKHKDGCLDKYKNLCNITIGDLTVILDKKKQFILQQQSRNYKKLAKSKSAKLYTLESRQASNLFDAEILKLQRKTDRQKSQKNNSKQTGQKLQIFANNPYQGQQIKIQQYKQANFSMIEKLQSRGSYSQKQLSIKPEQNIQEQNIKPQQNIQEQNIKPQQNIQEQNIKPEQNIQEQNIKPQQNIQQQNIKPQQNNQNIKLLQQYIQVDIKPQLKIQVQNMIPQRNIQQQRIKYSIEQENTQTMKYNSFSNEQIMNRFQNLKNKLNALRISHTIVHLSQTNEQQLDKIIQQIIISHNLQANTHKLINMLKKKQITQQSLIPLLNTIYNRAKSLDVFLNVYANINSQIEIQEIQHRNIQVLKNAVKMSTNFNLREVFQFEFVLILNQKKNIFDHYKKLFKNIKNNLKKFVKDENVYIISKIIFFGLGYTKHFQHRIFFYYIQKKIQALLTQKYHNQSLIATVYQRIELVLRKLPIEFIMKKRSIIYNRIQKHKGQPEFKAIMQILYKCLQTQKYGAQDLKLKNDIQDQLNRLKNLIQQTP